MTLDEMKELGRRAVACKHWRWVPGMVATHRWCKAIRILVDPYGDPMAGPNVVIWDGEDDLISETFVAVIDEYGLLGKFPCAESAYPFIPDLRDPATLGCLLHLVREAWGDGYIVQFGGWCRIAVYDRLDAEEAWEQGDTGEPVWCSIGKHKSDEEALVAALEAAP